MINRLINRSLISAALLKSKDLRYCQTDSGHSDQEYAEH